MPVQFAFQEGLIPAGDEESFFTRLRDWGFDAVEVWGENLDARLERVKTAARNAGLPVCGICPGGRGIRGSLLHESESSRALARKDISTLLHCAAELGGAGLNVVPEFGAEKFMALHPDHSDLTKRKKIFIEELAPLAAEAEKLGVQILLEPLNRYEAFFLLTVDQAAGLCRESGSPAVRILADLFHMNIEDADIPATLSRNIRLIPYLHLADSNRLLPGHGHTDFRAAFDALNRSGFSGALCMECGIPGDPDKTVPAALRHVRALWAEAQY
jgi:sugar phosphate isomerase/epimerase